MVIPDNLQTPATPARDKNRISFGRFDIDDTDSRNIFETPESPWKRTNFDERWSKVNDLLSNSRDNYSARSTSIESSSSLDLASSRQSSESSMSEQSVDNTIKRQNSQEETIGRDEDETNSSVIKTANAIEKDHSAILSLEFGEPENNWLEIGKKVETKRNMEVSDYLKNNSNATSSNRLLKRILPGLKKEGITSQRTSSVSANTSLVRTSSRSLKPSISKSSNLTPVASASVPTVPITPIVSTVSTASTAPTTPATSTASTTPSIAAARATSLVRIPSTVIIAPGTAKTGPILGLRKSSAPVNSDTTPSRSLSPTNTRTNRAASTSSSVFSHNSSTTYNSALTTPPMTPGNSCEESLPTSPDSTMDKPRLQIPKTRVLDAISSCGPLSSSSDSSISTAIGSDHSLSPSRRVVTDPTGSSRSSILFSSQPLSELFEQFNIEHNRIPELQSQLEGMRLQHIRLHKEQAHLSSILDNGVELYKHDASKREEMRNRRAELEQEISILDKTKYETGLLLTREYKKIRDTGSSDFWVRSR